MNDNLIIQLFITDKNKINSHYKQIINKNQEIKNYLDNRYKDGNDDYCETLYRIQHHLDKHPVCPNCGKYVRYINGTGYRKSCSVSCSKNYIKESYDTAITDDLIKNDYLIDNKINTNKLLIKYIKEHGYENYLLNRYKDSLNFGEIILDRNMDREEDCKKIIDRYSQEINKSINHVLENIYNAGWHDGRHAERDKWSKCEYLIIAPDKMDKITKILDNPPCKNCEFSTTERLTGCLAVPQKCEKYQEYSLLCELIKYFKTCAYKS